MKPTMEQLKDTKWWDENAPDGATHYDMAVDGCNWMKRNGSGHWFFYDDEIECYGWTFVKVKDLRSYGSYPEEFIERPTAETEPEVYDFDTVPSDITNNIGELDIGDVPVPEHGVDSTLYQRGNRYGRFVDNGRVSQGVKAALETGANWESLAPDMKEALFMIGHKMARIVNGDPEYTDSWHDIAGYARLIEQRLEDACKADSEA